MAFFLDSCICGLQEHGVLTEFGAVEFNSLKTFHGKLPVENSVGVGLFHDKIKAVFREFSEWLDQFPSRPIFVSDNPAFDWQWINYYFWYTIGRNPFGHSARRIGDFYAGAVGDFRRSTEWKKWRITPHDHNPVNDAMGNVEAFKKILEAIERRRGREWIRKEGR